MKNILFVALLILSIFSFAGIAAAQTVSPEKAKLIDELIQAMGSKEDMEKMFDTMMSGQDEAAKKAIDEMFAQDKSFSPKDREVIREVSKLATERINRRVAEFFKKEIDLTEISNQIFQGFYGKNFSEEELRTLIAFYQSPAGKKTIALAPELMRDSMTIVSDKMLPKLGTFFETMTKEEFDKIREEVSVKLGRPKPRKKVS